mgnify:FL=1
MLLISIGVYLATLFSVGPFAFSNEMISVLTLGVSPKMSSFGGFVNFKRVDLKGLDGFIISF